MRVAAVVLAAGAGTRIGGPKALLPIDDTTFLGRVVDTARRAGVARCVVVLGHHAERVRAALPAGADVTVALNPAPERGQLASLRAGLTAVGDVDGVLCWPVDHPRVQVATVAHVLRAALADPARALVPCVAGRGGHPTYFPRALFAALGALGDDEGGARALFARCPDAVARIEVADPGVRRDIDTPEDYAAVLGPRR